MANRAPERAEVVVIGGGILGTSTAFWLTQMGIRDVVLLEKQTLASGATGKTGAFIRVHYANPWDAGLAFEGWKVYSRWADIVGGDCGFVKSGFLLVAGPDKADALQKNVAILQQMGVPTYALTPEQVRDLYPSLSIEGVGAAAYEPESGHADGPTAAGSFARRAAQLGARILQGVEVKSIAVQGGRAVGVETSEGPIAASVVVNATGAWSVAFSRHLGIELPIRVKRSNEVFVRRPEGIQHPSMIDLVVGNSFRPDGQSLTFIGAKSDFPEDWDVDPDTHDVQVAMYIVDDAVGRVVRRIPGLAEGGLVKAAAGMDGYAEDRHLILGRAPGVEGLYLVVGGSGTGFKVAPGVGKCMAELIVHGESRSVDIRPFRLERFAENDQIVGPYEYGYVEGVGNKLL